MIFLSQKKHWMGFLVTRLNRWWFIGMRFWIAKAGKFYNIGETNFANSIFVIISTVMNQNNDKLMPSLWAMRYIDEMVYDVERQIVVKL